MEPLNRMTPATAEVLDALLNAPEPVWGLRIVQQTGRPAGSVYPILSRLEAGGWVTSVWEDDPGRPGPRRRLYELVADAVPSARASVARIQETRGTASARTAGANS